MRRQPRQGRWNGASGPALSSDERCALPRARSGTSLMFGNAPERTDDGAVLGHRRLACHPAGEHLRGELTQVVLAVRLFLTVLALPVLDRSVDAAVVFRLQQTGADEAGFPARARLHPPPEVLECLFLTL